MDEALTRECDFQSLVNSLDSIFIIMFNNYDQWVAYYDDIGIPPDVYSAYLPVIKALLDKKLPVILEFKHLAMLLGRTETYLGSVINGSKKHYRKFSIKKRSGGDREITAPYPALLDCQRWIYKNILSECKTSEAAHGFKKERSIISNASVHLDAVEMLTIDLENYFPSIAINKVIKVFIDLGYPHNVAFYLASLCCLNGKLPQGAPTSPALANIISNHLDRRLTGLADKFDLNYSRYADDLTFSGKNIPKWITSLVHQVVNDCGFKINHSKTRWAVSNHSRKLVTGLQIKNNQLTVTKKFRRALSQDLYFIKEYGLHSHLSVKKIRDPEYVNRLIGKLNFWKQVEPELKFVNSNLRLMKKLL